MKTKFSEVLNFEDLMFAGESIWNLALLAIIINFFTKTISILNVGYSTILWLSFALLLVIISVCAKYLEIVFDGYDRAKRRLKHDRRKFRRRTTRRKER